MATTEIRITGFGGQGVILAAYVIGKAAAVMEGRHATLNQSFGPEARGSACSAQLILSDEPVTYPYVRQTDILLAMSQDAYRQYVGEVREQGIILIDDSLVTRDSAHRTFGAPATRTAEKLGKKIVANMVMVGLFTSTTNVIQRDAARKAIQTSVPSGTEELNLAAFDRGLDLGDGLVAPSSREQASV
ncbi:MAG: 2-oxoacid:acceptor oxidoreductase family protein [Candidatus Krumholzibacteriia bacterium]